MIRFITRTDVHINDSAPESRKDDYKDAILAKLRQIGEVARERGAHAVLDNGDFFHNKAASRNSHMMVREVIDVHKAYPCPIYVNPGNHDFPYGNIEYIDRQPLGVLFSTRVFERMTDVQFEEGDLTVRVVGLPYKVDFDVFDFDIERKGEDVLIVCAHTYASPTGTESFGRESFLSYQDLAECTPDVFVFGHYHIDQGVQEVLGKTFINVGAVSRGSLTVDNMSRTPKITCVSVSKTAEGGIRVEVEEIELEVGASTDVFDVEKRERVREERREVEEFVQTLVTVAATEDANVVREIKDIEDLDDVVRERALAYLEGVAEGKT